MTTSAPTRVRTEAEAALIATFDSDDLRLRGATDLRAAAMARFAEAGLPHRRVEAWHYTDLRALLRRAAPAYSPDALSVEQAKKCLADVANRTNAARLVTLDGVFRPDLSDLADLPAGVTLASLADALIAGDREVLNALVGEGQGGDDAIVSLNAALMQDGVVLRIAPGAQVERPLALFNMMSGGGAHAAFVRSLVIVGDGASVEITETSGACSAAETQANEAFVVKIGDGCKVDYVSRLVNQHAGAVALHSLLLSMGEKSTFNGFNFIPSAGVVRRQ